MLPAPHRLRDAGQYRAVLRNKNAGRSGAKLLVVHVADTDAYETPPELRTGPRVGFVVSKAVGNAVVRSRVKRVLRHVVANELSHIPQQYDIVVRANPAIAGCSSDEVKAEFNSALVRAGKRIRSVSRETAAQ